MSSSETKHTKQKPILVLPSQKPPVNNLSNILHTLKSDRPFDKANIDIDNILVISNRIPALTWLEMFYLNSTLNFGIPPVLVFQLEVYYKVDRLLTGLTAQPKGTTAWWYSNKTSLFK